MLSNLFYVVSFSTGASSAVTAKRALDRYGHDLVDLVFMDTLVEDEDNYRFLRDCEAFFQHRIVILTDGRTPLQVAEQQHIIPNSSFAPCTVELKIKVFTQYLLSLQAAGLAPVALLGMSWKEQRRMAAPRKNYGEIGVEVDYPLVWEPMIADPVAEVRSWGLKPPRMYEMGFTHANCGNQGCVKSGANDWRRTLRYFPEAFARAETWEAEMRKDKRFMDYAFLRDRTGGQLRVAKPLSQLRAETEQADERYLRVLEFEDELSFGCTVECGVGTEN